MNQLLPPIAQTLASLGTVDTDELAAISNSQSNPHDIIRTVIERGLISSIDLSKQLAATFGTPLFDLNSLDLDAVPSDLIDFKLVERHNALPIYQHGSHLFVAIMDPTNTIALEEITFYTGMQVQPVQVEIEALTKLIETLNESQQGSLEDFLGDGDLELDIADDDAESNEEASETGFDPNEAPIVKYVNKILIDAINRGTSDIHLEPFETELRVRFRIDGILHTITTQPISFANRIIARVKVISRLDIAERRIPQDGRVKLKVSKSKAYDFRVSTLPTVYGEKIVMRILDSSAAKLDLNILGFTEQQLATYTQIVQRPYGMVLITGPTGSGKTVTLYSGLNKLNDPSKNISTVEDPVEIQLPGITQVNINEKANLGFANTLRAFLRQDPDIIMLGEIRDLETAEIAIKASQTGHMVLSTLHTNDAPSTLTRLLNMGVPAFNVASAVHLIVAQRLVRKLCSQCKTPLEIPEKALIAAGFQKENISKLDLYQPDKSGCAACTQGYTGRSAIYQVMPISETTKNLIMQGCTENDIEKQAQDEGILDLRAAGLIKVGNGETSLDEVERVTNA